MECSKVAPSIQTFKSMKISILALALIPALSLASIASAQSSIDELRTSKQIVLWTDADLPVYSIQISAMRTAPSDASFVKGLDVVYEYTADGVIKFYYGKYATYADANKALQGVRRNGFKEAFIVNLRGGAAKPSAVKSQVGKVVTVGGKPIELDPNTDYVIQVGAFRYPLYISFFENVGEVYEYRLNDKIFRYTTKPIKGSEVESEMARIKSLGYDRAFVVEYSLYQPYKIE